MHLFDWTSWALFIFSSFITSSLNPLTTDPRVSSFRISMKLPENIILELINEWKHNCRCWLVPKNSTKTIFFYETSTEVSFLSCNTIISEFKLVWLVSRFFGDTFTIFNILNLFQGRKITLRWTNLMPLKNGINSRIVIQFLSFVMHLRMVMVITLVRSMPCLV